MMQDYYQTLGILRNSNQDEIKKAYRKLASQHHPDKGGDKAKFQEIQEAYSVLSDEQKRANYDNPSQQVNNAWDNVPPDFEHFFSQFGGMFGGRPTQRPRNKNINLHTRVTLEQAFNGADLISDITLPSGKVQTINVKIPVGVHSGVTMRLAELGDDSIVNMPRGDVNIAIDVMPHQIFERNGDDLIMEVGISVWQAILGTTVNVDTIDNKKLDVRIPAGIQMGQLLSVPAAGMINFNDNRYRGRLLIKLDIKIPTSLTDSQKDLVKQISELN